ncbi:MULE transposase domain [Sesbania bispinosa]|nr:MULE transposase domain [Sesbania bispinosa]
MDESDGWWSKVFDDVRMSYSVDGFSVPNSTLVDEFDEEMVLPKKEIVDFSDVFTTDEIFESRDELLNWVCGIAMDHDFVVVIMRSDSGGIDGKIKRAETSDVVRDIMWAHPDAIKLPNLFHIVLIVDTTYKTNKHRLPLLEIVVVTSTELTFSVAFAYLERETKDNFTWALDKVRGMIRRSDALPQVIVTDRDFGLMNAIQSVFPSSYNLLSQFHIANNVKAKCKQLVAPRNTTTNRVESAHARLKRLLQDSRGDICNCWDAMNNLIILQHTEIKASFQRSIMNLEHRFNNRLYVEKVHAHWRRLTFTDQVSEAECAGVTLRLELNELERRFDEFNMDGKVAFKYKVRELAFPNTTSMCPPPEKVRTKGSTKGQSQTESSTKRDPSFFEYVDAMQSPNDSNSTRPSSSILHTKTQKRKKVVPMLDQFPTVMHDFIESVVDVARDGNCGYRAISALLGMGEESWPIIRQELYREICYWHHDYAQLFGDEQRCYQLRNSLLVDGRTSVAVDKWMTLPDIGYVIAFRYNVMLVSLSIDQSMTFFPLRGHPPTNHKILCIGYVDSNHWVQVIN